MKLIRFSYENDHAWLLVKGISCSWFQLHRPVGEEKQQHRVVQAE